MPRIPPWLFRKAKQHSANAAALLPACRDLPSAINELRWLQEHINATGTADRSQRLAHLCRKRGKGYPLQYILGSQPFGPLDIKCRPGVLIPRPETESYTSHLANLLRSGQVKVCSHGNPPGSLNIVDFCTGTGCIPLLLFSLLRRHFKLLNVAGLDISHQAVRLAEENITHNTRKGYISIASPGQRLEILKGDLFAYGDIPKLTKRRWDVLISNPPYISRQVWVYGQGQLGYSVRKYEPQAALVPGDDLLVPVGWRHEDLFYKRLFDIAHQLGVSVILLEIGDEQQAVRVLDGFARHALYPISTLEVWRDWPDLTPADKSPASLTISTGSGQSFNVPVKGAGQVRSIFIRVSSG